MTWLGLVVVALATYRAARLIARDRLTERLRLRIELWAWDHDNPVENPETGREEPAPRGALRTYVWELVRCLHCVGVWACAAALAAWLSGIEALQWCVFAAAAAGAQSIISTALAHALNTENEE